MEKWKEEFDNFYKHRRTQFDSHFRNSWACIKDGKFYKGTSTHCFAGMKNGMKGTTHILNGIHVSPLEPKMVRAYYNWLINSSPYSPIFITKNVDEVLKDAIEIIDADHPANLIVGGMTASRTASEYPYIVMLWYKLVELKVHPNVAFYYAHLFRCKYENPKTLGIVPALWNHTAIQTQEKSYGGKLYDVDGYVENFCRGIMKNINSDYSTVGTYNEVQSLWGGGIGKLSVRKEIIEWFKKLPSMTVGNNPFGNSSPKLEIDADFALYEDLNTYKAVDFDKTLPLIAEYLREGYKGEFK